MTDWRNARIEEAAKAIYALDPDRQAWDGDAYGFLEPGAERGRKRAIAQAAVALAVFEKALGEATVTPIAHEVTTDEREALEEALIYLDALNAERQIWYDDYRILHDIVSSALPRSEVPEPSAEPTCEHHDDELTRERDHHGIDPGPQGEPSDAQVEAALNEFYRGALSSTLADYGDRSVEAMRAALRAAGEVRS